jgi:hypothetical protein
MHFSRTSSYSRYMPTPYGSRGGTAFSADELRELRGALAVAPQPSRPAPGGLPGGRPAPPPELAEEKPKRDPEKEPRREPREPRREPGKPSPQPGKRPVPTPGEVFPPRRRPAPPKDALPA